MLPEVTVSGLEGPDGPKIPRRSKNMQKGGIFSKGNEVPFPPYLLSWVWVK